MGHKTDPSPFDGELVPAEAGANTKSLTHLDGRGREAEFRRQQHARTAALQALDHAFGDGLPYDGDRLEEVARTAFAHAADLLLAGGRALLLLKEHEEHGNFLARCERIGIDRFFAGKAIKAALKFGEGPRQQLATRLNRSKLLDLLAEDDAELDALAEGGTIAGLTLDEIDRMSTKEARAALRAARKAGREQQETTDRLLADKNKKIDDLHGQLMQAEQRSLLGDQQAELDAAQVGHDLVLRTQAVLDALYGLELLTSKLAERDLPVHLGEQLVNGLARISEHLDRVRMLGAAIAPDAGPDDAGWLTEALARDADAPRV